MRSCILLPLLFAAACAKGGSEERPQSEVQIASSHHLFGFKTAAGFVSVPIDPGLVFPVRGLLHLSTDSTYTIAPVGGVSGTDTYALASNGALSLYVAGSGRDPTVLFLGGYSLTTAAGAADLFFTDRVTTASSGAIGFRVRWLMIWRRCCGHPTFTLEKRSTLYCVPPGSLMTSNLVRVFPDRRTAHHPGGFTGSLRR